MSATPDTRPPEDVFDHPPSRTMVWWVLHSQGRLTFRGVIDTTGLSEPTVAEALSDLVSEDVVNKLPGADGRAPEYELADADRESK